MQTLDALASPSGLVEFALEVVEVQPLRAQTGLTILKKTERLCRQGLWSQRRLAVSAVTICVIMKISLIADMAVDVTSTRTVS